MKAAPVLRRLEARDLPACVAIYVGAYQAAPYHGCFSAELAERILRELHGQHPETCFVAEQGSKVVGFLLCSTLAGIKAVVEEFAVAPGHQGRGVGGALLEHALAVLKARGYQAVELVALREAPAYEFYKRRGFVESRRFRLLTREL